MLEQPQPQQESQQPAAPRSNTKWIALALGSGCALVACLGLVALLAVRFLAPNIAGMFNPTAVVQNITPVYQQPNNAGTPAPAQGPGNTMGDPNAPVKIVEYADFQCPYCQHFWQDTEPQIVDAYVKTGKVYYEYRSVGAFIGPESAAAAEAAYCAGDQGKFWEYHDILFSHWTGENVGDFTNQNLSQFASSLGLDQAAFDSCLSDGKYAPRLEQDVNNAKADGVQATPSFLINGKLLEGAQPFSAFQQAIDAALQGK